MKNKTVIKVTAAGFVSEAGATVALNAAAVLEFKAILVSTTPPSRTTGSGTDGHRGGGSFVLHFFQNWHNHVKFRPLCWVFIHAYLHQLANMGWYAGRDRGPQTFQSHLRAETDKHLEMYAGGKNRSLFTMNSKNSTQYEVVNLGSKIKIHRAHLHANFHVRQVSKWHLSGHQLPEQDSKAPHVCWPTVDLFRLLLQSCRSQESTSMSQKYRQWDTVRSAASMCKPTVTAAGNKVRFLGGSSLSLLHLTTLMPFFKNVWK